MINDADLTPESLKKTLQTKNNLHLTLSFVISGMDTDLQDETRKSVLENVQEDILDNETLNFVRGRLLSRLLPKDADIHSAITLAEEISAFNLVKLYKEVLNSQPNIEVVLKSWNEINWSEYRNYGDKNEVEKFLIDHSVFTSMVSAFASDDVKKAINMAVVNFGMLPALTKTYHGMPKLLNDFKAKILKNSEVKPLQKTETIVEGKELKTAAKSRVKQKSYPEMIDELLVSVDEYKKEHKRDRSKKLLAFETKTAADKQIAAIKENIKQGNKIEVLRFLHGLEVFHRATGKKEHIAKTLCSLSTFALECNQLDIADELVQYAIMFNVNDPVVYNQHAEVLKHKGDFDEARRIYEETIVKFPENVVARNGRNVIYMLMGKFDDVFPNLRNDYPITSDDFIEYHVSAMYYLRTGNIQEAIRRLEYGFENSPSKSNKEYFANALAVAKIRARDFESAEEILDCNVVDLSKYKKEQCIVMRAHCLAGRDRKEEAKKSLEEISKTGSLTPELLQLTQLISKRFGLEDDAASSDMPVDTESLDKNIDDLYFRLVA
ncbi:MAG: hypothetical protein HQK88_05880 [Nitrospirae bacterium]|nr:hypothetical protein [Nitrospirota bacterium]MBF0520602.1 hypothetical protein [Nitrospirota bacterium]MBF0534625.1 hypothetical protein [Nitrospirota bacterium]MBF0616331.1 hypothetical protein [Nitrospirota bacterium]